MPSSGVRAPAPIRLVFSGQSMLYLPEAPRDIPWMVSRQLGHLPYQNIGIGGHGWYDLQAFVNDPDGLIAQARNIPGCIDLLVMFGGQGDIINANPSGQQTGAVAYERAETYADTARAAGFHYIVGVTWPHIGPNVLGTGRPTTTEYTNWHDAVELYRTDPDDIFDAVAECHNAPLDDATDLDYFMIDRTHLVQLGGDVAADIIAPVVATVLGL